MSEPTPTTTIASPNCPAWCRDVGCHTEIAGDSWYYHSAVLVVEPDITKVEASICETFGEPVTAADCGVAVGTLTLGLDDARRVAEAILAAVTMIEEATR